MRMGSSPLTRGKRAERHPEHHGPGLIPAHAGKTPSRLPRLSPDGAHPRSRGENMTPHDRPEDPEGSSPLTRGKRVAVSAACVTDGLIPAHAGKTVSGSPWGGGRGAHPRSRGENAGRLVSTCAHAGSSPLTRGKPHVVVEVAGFGGLIPAHAGKTRPANTPRPASWAHPRSRGENTPCPSPAWTQPGSSPLTRGKHGGGGSNGGAERLIPAHAGKT